MDRLRRAQETDDKKTPNIIIVMSWKGSKRGYQLV